MVEKKIVKRRHKDILNFCKRYMSEKGFPPSVREIGDRIEVYQLNVSLHAGNARNGADYFWPGVFSESIYTSGCEVCI